MTKSDKFAIYGNAVFFQALWFASVLGAKADVIWPAGLVLIILICWGCAFSRKLQADLRMAIVGILVAFSVEPVWIGQGLVVYPLQPASFFPPGWIVALWVGFAISFNYSLSWLRNRYLLGALLGGIGSVCSITGAYRLDAVDMPHGWFAFAVQYGVIWAMIVPVLAWYSAKTTGNRAQEALSGS